MQISSVAVTLAVVGCASTAGNGDGGKGDGEGGSSSGSSGAGGTNGAGASNGGVSGTGTGGTSATGGTTSTGGSGGSGATGGSAGKGGAAGSGGKGGAAGSAGKGGSAGTGGTSAPSAKFVGNITTRNQVRSDFINFWNQITPENEGKWGTIESTRDRMNWVGTDAVRDYAHQHNIPYRGHTLVWGSQQPTWIGGLSASEQRAEVEEWIREFCTRYPDVAMIDVVNEPPPHTTPPYMNAIGGAGTSGYDWIVQSFVWARQYCPNAILMLNDYNNIEYEADVARTITIVQAILAAGAPIDAVGAQAHDVYKLQTSVVSGFINRVASQTGLPVYITEYDIDLANDAEQSSVMQAQFPMFWNNANVAGITLWGYVSGQTWKPNTGLMSSSGQQRPAMVWLMDFLER